MILCSLLEEKSSLCLGLAEDIKKIVTEAVEGCISSKLSSADAGEHGGSSPSYASAVTGRPRVNVSCGPMVEVPDTTSFYVVPIEENSDKFTSSQKTKEILCRILRPSDCA